MCSLQLWILGFGQSKCLTSPREGQLYISHRAQGHSGRGEGRRCGRWPTRPPCTAGRTALGGQQRSPPRTSSNKKMTKKCKMQEMTPTPVTAHDKSDADVSAVMSAEISVFSNVFSMLINQVSQAKVNSMWVLSSLLMSPVVSSPWPIQSIQSTLILLKVHRWLILSQFHEFVPVLANTRRHPSSSCFTCCPIASNTVTWLIAVASFCEDRSETTATGNKRMKIDVLLGSSPIPHHRLVIWA